MTQRQPILMILLLLMTIDVHAAPLNKFGSMSTQAPIQQQFPVQQQLAPAYIAPAVEAPKTEPEKKTKSLDKITSLLSKLSLKSLKKWQQRFKEKRDKASLQSKDALHNYYDRLFKFCQTLIQKKEAEQ